MIVVLLMVYFTNQTIPNRIGEDNNSFSKHEWATIESNTLEVKKKIKEVYNCNIYSLNPFINFGLEGHKYEQVHDD